MAVDARSILNYTSTDADFRTWAQSVHDMLIAAGLVQTADTGQINFATATRPAANTAGGYGMYRFNDAEQATLPIFVRVSYGQGNYANLPAIGLTVGTATDGAGTLTGTAVSGFSSYYQWRNAADAAGTSRPAYCSHADGHLVIGFGLEFTAGYGATLIVERPKNGDGTRATDGYLFWGEGSSGSATSQRFVQAVRAAGGGPAIQTGTPGLLIPDMSITTLDDVAGVDVALGPIPWVLNGNLRFSAALAIDSANVSGDVQGAVSIFGQSRNYRALSLIFPYGNSTVVVPYY